MKSLLLTLQAAVSEALVAAFGDELADTDPLVAATNNPKFGDYQANVALSLSKKLKMSPRAIAEKLIEHLQIDSIS